MPDSSPAPQNPPPPLDLPKRLLLALEKPEGFHQLVGPRNGPLATASILYNHDAGQKRHLAALVFDSAWIQQSALAGDLLNTVLKARGQEGAPPETGPVTAHLTDDTSPWAIAELAQGIWLTDQIAKNGRAPIPQAIQIIRLAAQALAWWHTSKQLAGPILPSEIWAPLDGKSAQFPFFGLIGSFLTENWLLAEAGKPLVPSCPPEVLDGGAWDTSADLYALGCLSYWLLTGESPYSANTPGELREQQRARKPRTPPELRMGVPQALSELVMRLISTEAHERPLKAQPVADRLAVLSSNSTNLAQTGDGYGVRADLRGATPPARPATSLMDEEIKRLKSDAETKPDDPEIWLKLAQAQLRLGRPGDAILSTEKALKINPRMGAAVLLRADCLLAKGDVKKALNDLQIIAKALPNAPQVLLRLAKAHAADGNHPKSIAECDSALKAEPKNLEALTLRAKAYQATNQNAKALDDLDEAIHLAKAAKPAVLAKLLALRGEINLHLNRHEEAQADIDSALAADPASVSARQVRVHYLLAVGKPVEAEADCDLLVNQAGRMAWPWLLRAKQRQMAGEYMLALEDLDQALLLESTPHSMAQTALLLAAAPDKNVRDSDRALDLGRKAAEDTGWDDPFVLEAVAAAYAACGQTETATGWIFKAITQAKGEDRDRLQETLKLYKAGKPYRLGK